MARLTEMRASTMVKEGVFRDLAHAAEFVGAMDRLRESGKY